MPSGSPPAFFVDRSLGRHLVPNALRAAGAVVHAMADVYGERVGQSLDDELGIEINICPVEPIVKLVWTTIRLGR